MDTAAKIIVTKDNRFFVVQGKLKTHTDVLSVLEYHKISFPFPVKNKREILDPGKFQKGNSRFNLFFKAI